MTTGALEVAVIIASIVGRTPQLVWRLIRGVNMRRPTSNKSFELRTIFMRLIAHISLSAPLPRGTCMLSPVATTKNFDDQIRMQMSERHAAQWTQDCSCESLRRQGAGALLARALDGPLGANNSLRPKKGSRPVSNSGPHVPCSLHRGRQADELPRRGRDVEEAMEVSGRSSELGRKG